MKARMLSLAGVLALALLFPDGAAATPAQRASQTDAFETSRERPLLARRRKRQRKAPPPAKQPPPPAAAAKEAAVDAATRQGPTRVEFDERMLQGQTNKANAIYLFQRRESALRSLVKKRTGFRAEIDEALE